jgi:hypothetical protein
MDRGLIVGAIAFVAGFAAERLFTSLTKDIARYEKMREMSGQPPILKEVFGAVVGGATGESVPAWKEGATGLIADLTADVVRYAKMKGM